MGESKPKTINIEAVNTRTVMTTVMTTVDFPLYNTLVEKLKSQPEKKQLDWRKITNGINGIKELTIFETIYAFIYHHSALHNNRSVSKNNIPYHGKVYDPSSGRGVLFNIDSLPQDLQHIISLYIELIYM